MHKLKFPFTEVYFLGLQKFAPQAAKQRKFCLLWRILSLKLYESSS